MDKILDLGDVFGLGASNFNAALLIPVVFVVFGAVGVFIFGFKRMESPRFRKFVEANSSTNTNRKKRRNAGGSAESNSRLGTASSGGKILKQVASQLQPQVTLSQQKANTKKTTKEATVPVVKSGGAPATPNKRQVNGGAMQTTIKSTKNTTKALNKKGVVLSVLTNVKDDGDGEGEWKTVITKKQKQKQPTDSLIQAVAEVVAVTINGNGSAKSTPTKKKSNAKKIKNSEQTGVDSDVAGTPLTPPAAVAIDDESNIENDTVVVQPEIQQQLIIIADNEASENVPIPIIPADGPSLDGTNTNVAFDELGDAVWTESKPQKKNKRRALRE